MMTHTSPSPPAQHDENSLLRLAYPVVVFFVALFAWNSTGESAKTIDSSLPTLTENSTPLKHEPATNDLPGSPPSCEIKGARGSLAMEKTTACSPVRETRTSQASSDVRDGRSPASRQ